MPAFDKSSFSTSRRTLPLRVLVPAAAAALLAVPVTGIASAAMVVERPARPLPVMVTGAYGMARPVVWIAPPAPRVMVLPPPRPGWVWSPGYWRWNGGAYVWIGGVWLAERPGFSFVPAHWDRFPGGWRFVPGGWIRRPL